MYHLIFVCVYVYFFSLQSLLTEQNKCNARDQAIDVVLRKYFCVKNLCHLFLLLVANAFLMCNFDFSFLL